MPHDRGDRGGLAGKNRRAASRHPLQDRFAHTAVDEHSDEVIELRPGEKLTQPLTAGPPDCLRHYLRGELRAQGPRPVFYLALKLGTQLKHYLPRFKRLPIL